MPVAPHKIKLCEDTARRYSMPVLLEFCSALACHENIPPPHMVVEDSPTDSHRGSVEKIPQGVFESVCVSPDLQPAAEKLQGRRRVVRLPGPHAPVAGGLCGQALPLQDREQRSFQGRCTHQLGRAALARCTPVPVWATDNFLWAQAERQFPDMEVPPTCSCCHSCLSTCTARA